MENIKKILCALVALMLIFAVGCGDSDTEQGTENQTQQGSQANADMLSGKHHAKITVKEYGEIELELDADEAPITVTNFVKLVKEGFYDGLTFHRIMSGFMIQGGDPEGNGTGGSSENIKGEFAENGVTNNIKHVRGTISMARANDPNSASSQFFIVHQTSEMNSYSLDGRYAAFGNVTKGIEVVDAIAQKTPVQDSNGTTLKEDQPIIEKIEIID